jgi:xanthine dehydrogenase accessory factor
VIRSPSSNIGGPRVGSHALLDNAAIRSTGDWGTGSALFDATQYVSETVAAGRRGVVHEIGSAEVAFEVVMPAIRLVVCGAGPDAAPVARFASELGWDVTVVDHRPVTEARSARFPRARVVECGDALQLAHVLPLNQRFAAVVMSHHLVRDRDYLYSLLKSDLTYLGVLGPRARTERMLTELIAREGSLPHIDGRFFSPVGLDIGGEGPDAIALSIISQISAVTSGRTGGHLRDRRAPLHASPPPEMAAGRI